MKKLFFITLAAIVAVAGSANAQDYQKNILGVRAGMNISKITASNGGMSASTSSLVGFNIGVSDQFLLLKSKPLYLETGLYFSTKGGKVNYNIETEGGGYDYSTKMTPMYLQIPLLINYHFAINDKFSVQPAVGAYYAFGICGKVKEDGEKENIFSKNGFKRSDVGLRFGVNFGYDKFILGVSYDLGLSNIAQGSDSEDGKFKNRVFAINLGYNF